MIAQVQLGHRLREALRRVRRPLTAAELHAALNEPIEGQDGPGDAVALIDLELRRLERAGLVDRGFEVVGRAGERSQTAIAGAPTYGVSC